MKRMLPALLKLLLVLAAVSHGTATFCNITENKALVQCYGALGQSVSIYPLSTSFKIDSLEVFFQGKEFFRFRANRPPYYRSCQNRCQLMKNGTLRLDHAMKSDSGIYTIESINEKGIIKLKRNISLTIQDPVSPPVLSQLCLSHGEIRASCNSTGEDPQYSWTLNNSPLDGGVAFLSNETQTVILRRNVSGSITCTASNRVSSEHTTQELLKCPGLGAPVICTLGDGTEIAVRMNASLNASALLDNTEIFFRAGGAEMVSAVCNRRPQQAPPTCDPVSPPALSQLCLSRGEIRVTCSSTGENPQYSWTLNNSPLDGGVAFLSNETQTVILRRDVSGSITCTASNRVSSKHTTQELLKCPGLGAPVNCTLSNETKIEVRMNASLNASSLLDNTEIFFRAGGAEMVSAVCTSRPHTSDSQKSPPTSGYKRLLLLLGACGVLAILFATLRIASRYREGPNTGIGPEREQTLHPF